MASRMRMGFVVMVLLCGARAGWAQGSASSGQSMPDSNMAAPSGNTGAANNGIGHQGGLTANAGSHSSTVTGPAAAAQIPTHPKPPSDASRNNPRLENDPVQGGGAQPH